MSRGVVDILGPGKEDELFQSFVRVQLSEDESSEENYNFSYGTTKPAITENVKQTSKDSKSSKKPPVKFEQETKIRRTKGATKIDSELLKKRKPKESFNEVYTDKDRAAAVSAGSYDIKQSLKLKQKQDRHDALLIPEDSDPSALIALGLKEVKSGNTENALLSLTKALDLNPNDINALIGRSKCFLLVGEPGKALQDAENALVVDKNNIRAIFQKAESLYYLGQFEESLIYFHSGLRARPELASFRLGVQKTQKAIENTIGIKGDARKISQSLKYTSYPIKQANSISTINLEKSKSNPNIRGKTAKISSRKLLGELCVDQEYLENLLKHPDLKRADIEMENVSSLAKDAVEFLYKRQEFWRQQRPCTALPKQKHTNPDNIPNWY